MCWWLRRSGGSVRHFVQILALDSTWWRFSTERFPDPFPEGWLDLGGRWWTDNLSKPTQTLSAVDCGQLTLNQRVPRSSLGRPPSLECASQSGTGGISDVSV